MGIYRPRAEYLRGAARNYQVRCLCATLCFVEGLCREQCGHKAKTGCRMWAFVGVVLVSLQAFFVKQRNFDFL